MSDREPEVSRDEECLASRGVLSLASSPLSSPMFTGSKMMYGRVERARPVAGGWQRVVAEATSTTEPGGLPKAAASPSSEFP